MAPRLHEISEALYKQQASTLKESEIYEARTFEAVKLLFIQLSYLNCPGVSL